MVKLRLGIGAKATILLSRMHPKNLISKASPNQTKADKAEGLIVVSEGPKPIRCEEKLVVVFRHPPKDQQTEEFKCWVLHWFVHVTEEGDKAGLFSTEGGGGENHSGAAEGTIRNLNIMDLAENPQETVPSEVALFLGSETTGMNRDNAALITNICPDMVDDNNQPLPENIPTEEQQATTANLPQIFSSWGHGGSCYHCLEGGRKHKARLSFNTDVNPTIKQLFEMFFFKDFILKVILPETNKHIQEDKHRPMTYGEFLHWLGLWFLMATITGPDRTAFWSMVRLIVLLVRPCDLAISCQKSGLK